MYRRLKKAEYLLRAHRKRSAASAGVHRSGRADDLSEVAALDKLPELLRMFVLCQLRKFSLTKKARRFSPSEKALFLSIYKHSPKCYRYMERIFCFPSSRTLRRSLADLQLQPGINERYFAYLNELSQRLEPQDKYCVLLFDEMLLSANLSYDRKRDSVEGLEDFGNGKRPRVADHALVFMIRGLSKCWKQAIAFYFVQSATKKYTLKACIKQVIQAIHGRTEFRVLASVSDMATTNVSAVRSLAEDIGKPQHAVYSIDNHEIVHIWDVPHLLKSVRNNFLVKDIVFEGHTATWSDIILVYDSANKRVDGKLSDLTEAHVRPTLKQKMRVKFAAQVFSLSVFRALAFIDTGLALCNQQASHKGTTEFVLFMNNLFDSLNSDQSSQSKQGPVTVASSHWELWGEAKEKISRLMFFKKGVAIGKPPCVSGFLQTIGNVQALWTRLTALGFTHLYTRRLNQDPLENLFGAIRGLGGQNPNPSCAQFRYAFATVVCNAAVRGGVGSNCEYDGDQLLLSMRSLLALSSSAPEVFAPTPAPAPVPTQAPETPSSSSQIVPARNSSVLPAVRIQARRYSSSDIAAYICREVLHRDCQTCVSFFLSETRPGSHAAVRLRDDGTQEPLLMSPSSQLLEVVDREIDRISLLVPEVIHLPNVLQTLNTRFNLEVPFVCMRHTDTVLSIKKVLCYVALLRFLRTSNLKIKRRDQRPNPVVDRFLS